MTRSLRDRLAAADPAPEVAPYAPDVLERVIRETTSTRSAPTRRRRTWPFRGVVAGVGLALGAGAAASIATLLPADQLATAPLSGPTIVNGTGPDSVALPAPPEGALYVHYELACYDTTFCGTPLGALEGDAPMTLVDRGAFPLTSGIDSPEALAPAEGLPLTVAPDTQWRLYTIYTDALHLDPATLDDGRTLGVPSPSSIPDLIPGKATNGEIGWIDYAQLTWGGSEAGLPGPRADTLPVYAADGLTVIGSADVSTTYP